MHVDHGAGDGTQQPASLQGALKQSRGVKAKVEACADDIGTATVRVEAAIAGGARTLSAHKTLALGVEVGSKVQECADDLCEVTETIADGIKHQRMTEAALAEARRALADTQAELQRAKEAEATARLKALHDSTTGLPNRELFDNRLDQAIRAAKRHGWTLAVMFFDLDRFKTINDTHGHATGDAVLQEVANRLSAHAREEDTVCRTGGDEFLYLLINPQARHNVEHIARSVSERVGQDILLSGTPLNVKASVGIAVYPGDADTGEQLIKLADAAMYLAKHRQSEYAFADELEDTHSARSP